MVCYVPSTMMKKRGRAGKTETFSVSVDAKTKNALRELADREFGGNMSALVTDFAAEARRRTAAGDYLRRHAIPTLDAVETDALHAQIDAEILAAKRRPRKHTVA